MVHDDKRELVEGLEWLKRRMEAELRADLDWLRRKSGLESGASWETLLLCAQLWNEAERMRRGLLAASSDEGNEP
jgi:hypothetical protein